MTSEDHVLILDTTLRDGALCPGVQLDAAKKMMIADSLADLGVDVIEAGFPGVSTEEQLTVQEIARHVQGPVIAALARCTVEDVEAAWAALKDASRARCHVFLPTGRLRRDLSPAQAAKEIVALATEGVRRARDRFVDVAFSAEDAASAEPELLLELHECVAEAGATTFSIADTSGRVLPTMLAATVDGLVRRRKGGSVVSVHCHDDLGLAVANSIAAVTHGARQIECTVNGLGIRAGNTPLEEIVAVLARHASVLGVRTRIGIEHLEKVSRLVAELTGVPIPAGKAVVGENVRRGGTSPCCGSTRREGSAS